MTEIVKGYWFVEEHRLRFKSDPWASSSFVGPRDSGEFDALKDQVADLSQKLEMLDEYLVDAVTGKIDTSGQ